MIKLKDIAGGSLNIGDWEASSETILIRVDGYVDTMRRIKLDELITALRIETGTDCYLSGNLYPMPSDGIAEAKRFLDSRYPPVEVWQPVEYKDIKLGDTVRRCNSPGTNTILVSEIKYVYNTKNTMLVAGEVVRSAEFGLCSTKRKSNFIDGMSKLERLVKDGS